MSSANVGRGALSLNTKVLISQGCQVEPRQPVTRARLDGLEDVHGGVVDEHVERAVLGDRGGEQALDVVFIRHVGLKLQRMQHAAETALRERAAQAGAPYAADDPAPRAITGAAKGAFADAIDRAMSAVSPRG
jgi:hypothetical protein